LLKPGEQLSASAKNSINARFKSIFNGYRALRFPASEPLFQLLDAQHNLYQVRNCVLTLLQLNETDFSL
jgi:hypothetical protein